MWRSSSNSLLSSLRTSRHTRGRSNLLCGAIGQAGSALFGNYSVILPPEPFVWGVSHIHRRSVPDHIPRPIYANADYAQDPEPQDHIEFDESIVKLGTEEETKLRSAAKLAKEIRDFAGSLVKVSSFSVCVMRMHTHDLRSRRRQGLPRILLIKLFTKLSFRVVHIQAPCSIEGTRKHAALV